MIERLFNILDFYYSELYEDNEITMDNFKKILETDPIQIIEMLMDIID